jgi:plastocyanin
MNNDKETSMRITLAAAAALAALAGGAAGAADFTITQHDNQFNAKELSAHVGDTVSFRNDDPHFHNIFSLSDAQSFDLGSYPKGESRKVTLSKEGEIDVECAIHPNMKMTIKVAK